MRVLGGKDVVIRGLLLQHEPHALDVVSGEAPIAGGFQVAEVELVLEAHGDATDGSRDLAGDEIFSAAGRLVVEEDAVAGEHAVRLPVVDGVVVSRHFGHGVRAARVEHCGLVLRRRSGAVHLR